MDMNKNKKNNYDVLDKILEDANIPERGGGKRWYAPDPNDPNNGMWITEDYDIADVQRQNDAIEKYLRS